VFRHRVVKNLGGEIAGESVLPDIGEGLDERRHGLVGVRSVRGILNERGDRLPHLGPALIVDQSLETPANGCHQLYQLLEFGAHDSVSLAFTQQILENLRLDQCLERNAQLRAGQLEHRPLWRYR